MVGGQWWSPPAPLPAASNVVSSRCGRSENRRSKSFEPRSALQGFADARLASELSYVEERLSVLELKFDTVERNLKAHSASSATSTRRGTFEPSTGT